MLKGKTEAEVRKEILALVSEYHGVPRQNILFGSYPG